MTLSASTDPPLSPKDEQVIARLERLGCPSDVLEEANAELRWHTSTEYDRWFVARRGRSCRSTEFEVNVVLRGVAREGCWVVPIGDVIDDQEVPASGAGEEIVSEMRDLVDRIASMTPGEQGIALSFMAYELHHFVTRGETNKVEEAHTLLQRAITAALSLS